MNIDSMKRALNDFENVPVISLGDIVKVNNFIGKVIKEYPEEGYEVVDVEFPAVGAINTMIGFNSRLLLKVEDPIDKIKKLGYVIDDKNEDYILFQKNYIKIAINIRTNHMISYDAESKEGILVDADTISLMLDYLSFMRYKRLFKELMK